MTSYSVLIHVLVFVRMVLVLIVTVFIILLITGLHFEAKCDTILKIGGAP